MLKRTHNCGQLRLEDAGKKVALAGWVHSYRDHGNLVFIDLRDREGLTQIVFDPETQPEMHKLAKTARCEWVIAAEGEVQPRSEGMENPKLATGEIEVAIERLEILNTSKTPPFEMDSAEKTGEELRLENRYIDLRRPKMQNKLRTRHQVTMIVRDYFDKLGFWEIETPMLAKSTPEGARDFLVPSRLSQNCFYALPQSPQLFKQILMVSGVEKYFQIVRCFRDEDPRADRQAEFTQIDVEMSFVDEDDVIAVHQSLVARVWKRILDIDVPMPMRRMTYLTFLLRPLKKAGSSRASAPRAAINIPEAISKRRSRALSATTAPRGWPGARSRPKTASFRCWEVPPNSSVLICRSSCSNVLGRRMAIYFCLSPTAKMRQTRRWLRCGASLPAT